MVAVSHSYLWCPVSTHLHHGNTAPLIPTCQLVTTLSLISHSLSTLQIMACSAIYFLDNKGKVLLCRNYRGDIDNSVIDSFISKFRQYTAVVTVS